MTMGRRVAFVTAALVLTLAMIEALSFVAHALIFEESFSYRDAQSERMRLAGTSSEMPSFERPRDGENDNNAQSLHPYLGYVLDPSRTPLWPVNEYGFLGEPPPFAGAPDAGPDPERRPVSVVVVGGSVAETLATWGRAHLIAALEDVEAFEGRPIHLASLALRGMKQPQQLLTIDWFESLGAQIDVVINLDGYNEIMIANENAAQGTFPFYPRRWKLRVEGIAEPALLSRAGQVVNLEQLRAALAARVARSPLRASVTANVLWKLADRGFATRIATSRGTLNEALLARDDRATYEATGPERSYADDAARYRDLAAYWKRSSMLLAQKAEAYGFDYFHFLQPNQHVANSKPMGPEEEALALTPTWFNKEQATESYPYLIAAGKELLAAGAPFTDLTMMFREVHEPVYSDPCCHFNALGNELIAREIARVVGLAYAQHQEEQR